MDAAPRPETTVIKLGRPPTVPDGPLNVPITPASALQAGGVAGYARDGHAPWAALEEVIGALEGGRALAFSTGMAAATAAIGLFPAGAVVVAPAVAYMDVRRSMLRLQEAGRAEVRFVDITDTDAVLAACDGANVLWVESPTNPLLGIADLPALCAAARDRGILCVVDNTFATPLLQRPLELGADVVVHSATKAMGGHSDLLLGAAVTADETHLAALREARELGGATPGALEAYLCLRGLRTLPLRLERAQHNAGVLAERLADHRRRPRGALPRPGVPPAASTQSRDPRRPRVHAHLPRSRRRRTRRCARRGGHRPHARHQPRRRRDDARAPRPLSR